MTLVTPVQVAGWSDEHVLIVDAKLGDLRRQAEQRGGLGHRGPEPTDDIVLLDDQDAARLTSGSLHRLDIHWFQVDSVEHTNRDIFAQQSL